MIDPPYGGELLVDFTSLRPRGLALAFARGLFMLVAPRGPILVRSSIKTYVTQLPNFFAYLAGTGDRINGPADLRADHIDGFERWLAAQGKSRTHAPTYVAKVVSVLRRIAADGPELVDPGLRERLRYVSSHPHVRPHPRDAYSPYVARQLRDAARADLVAIEARLRSGPRLDEVPEIEGAYRQAHAAIEARGVLHHRDPACQSLYKLRWIRELSGARFNLSLHAAHYLTAHDVVPLLVLLSLETGLELECCKSLTIDCLRNASGGTVDVAYTKLRAHGAEHSSDALAAAASALVTTTYPTVTPLTAEAPGIGPIATAIGARTCADALGISPDAGILVDVSEVDGAPAAVLIATDGGARTAYAVSRSCTTRSPMLIAGPIALP